MDCYFSFAPQVGLLNFEVTCGIAPLIMAGQFARHLCVNDSKHFHTSVVYATALNTITLPFRMEVSGPTATSQEKGVGSSDMGNMVRLVSCSQQKKVALLEAAVPGPALPGTFSFCIYVLIWFSAVPFQIYQLSSLNVRLLVSSIIFDFAESFIHA